MKRKHLARFVLFTLIAALSSILYVKAAPFFFFIVAVLIMGIVVLFLIVVVWWCIEHWFDEGGLV